MQGIARRLLHSTALCSSSSTTTASLSPDSNSKLVSLCYAGRLKDALVEMCTLGASVRFKGYDALTFLCADRELLSAGRWVHAHMIKCRYLPPVYLAARMVVMYVKCGSLVDARNVFDRMPEKNVVAWSSMMSGYSKNGRHDETIGLFVKMMGSSAMPNEFTLATVLTSCAAPFRLDFGRQLHSLAIKTNYDSHIFVGSSLLDMYAKASKIHDARAVFDILPERDVVSCTAVISGYAQLGFDQEALDMFQKLYKEGMTCNYVTFASLLTAISGLAAVDYGRQVHGLTIRNGLPYFVVLQNALIDMYSKCGNLVYSRRVFENMPERTVISWNSMLVSYGKHGLGKEVIKLFKMMHEQVKPDRLSYMAVLYGCSHGGLVDEGLDLFDSLLKDKSIEPVIEHYGVVVDLLGRAGRIEKALDFMANMPFKATSAMWGSLLGACRAHSNFFAAEYVANKILEVEPENAGNYVILSNIFAAAGRWDDVLKVRESMDKRTVLKDAGRSWINLERTVHYFYSNDQVHPQKDEIYGKLRELYVKVKEAGYVPDLSCVLHDVDDEQKERILLGHSEKLAIAFGLMRTYDQENIQIMKNLRICVDCHNFGKFVSLISGRELTIRDSNRFHRIIAGQCSCGDYW